jgi:hypothetical protein
MQTLTIRAGTLEVADGLFVALDAFQPEMTTSQHGGYDVTVSINQDPSQLIAILDALQNHLTRHEEGVLVELDGRRYSLEPG